MKRYCPVHHLDLVAHRASYGLFCPTAGCTIIGHTSEHDGKFRISDIRTRDARHLAHDAFDRLYKNGPMSKRKAYDWLARELRLSGPACHIKHFDIAMCERVIELSAAKLRAVASYA